MKSFGKSSEKGSVLLKNIVPVSALENHLAVSFLVKHIGVVRHEKRRSKKHSYFN